MKTFFSALVTAILVGGCTTFTVAPENSVDHAPLGRVEAVAAHLSDPSQDLDRPATDDPVVVNLQGISSLIRGDHQDAVTQFRKAFNLVKDRKYLATERELPKLYPADPKTKSSLRAEPNGRVAEVLKLYSTGRGSHADVLDALRERPGLLPYPPTFKSTIGLCLEAISDDIGRMEAFQPRVVSYYNPERDSSIQVTEMNTAVSTNLLIAGVLASDLGVVNEAVTLLKTITSLGRETRFVLGFGLWLLDDKAHASYLTQSERSILQF